MGDPRPVACVGRYNVRRNFRQSGVHWRRYRVSCRVHRDLLLWRTGKHADKVDFPGNDGRCSSGGTMVIIESHGESY